MRSSRSPLCQLAASIIGRFGTGPFGAPDQLCIASSCACVPRTLRWASSRSRSVDTGTARAVGTSQEVKQRDAGSEQTGTKLNYTFWESAEVLFSEKPNTHTVVGRWDWHLWQIFVALLPSVAVYQFVRIARSDLAEADAAVAEAEAEAANQTLRLAHSDTKSQSRQEAEPQRILDQAHDNQLMKKRLDELEALLKSIQFDIEQKNSDKTAESSGPRNTVEPPLLHSTPPRMIVSEPSV